MSETPEEFTLVGGTAIALRLGHRPSVDFDFFASTPFVLIVEIDDAVQEHVAEIMAKYPRLVDTVKGRSGSDPFVIALAASTEPSMVVVTEEYTGKTRIPDVCTAENIDYCGLADLIEREDWKFE